MASKKPTQAELRAFRRDLAKLKAKGLAYTGKDIRSQKPTRHALRTIEKFRDVLEGRADVVSVPRGKSKNYEGYARTATKVVVPKVMVSERSRYDKKSDMIITTYKVPSGTVRMSRKKRTLEELRDLEGPNVQFTIYVKRGGEYRKYGAPKIQELAGRFGERSSFENWLDWLDYVNVDILDPKSPGAEIETLPAPERKPRKKKRRVNATGRN